MVPAGQPPFPCIRCNQHIRNHTVVSPDASGRCAGGFLYACEEVKDVDV